MEYGRNGYQSGLRRPDRKSARSILVLFRCQQWGGGGGGILSQD